MANYDAQINILVGGINRINDLENRLSRIQDTIEEINTLGAEGVFGRTTNLGTYNRALRELNATADAVRRQTTEQQQANVATREQLLLYSRLNREQNLYRRRSAAFTEESRGVRETNSRVVELTTQLRSAQRAFSALFADADIEGVRVLNTEISALLEELREINRLATGTKNVGANTAQLQSQADGWAQQIRVLRQRASTLSENEEILARLTIAERNLIQLRNRDMTFREEANVRLGKQELANAAALVKAEEDLASMRRRDSADYERQLNRQQSQIKNTLQLVSKTLKAAGSATLDAITFGKGASVARGTRNAAIRGGLGLGALGLGGAYAATQQAIGNVDLGVLQGPVSHAATAIGGAVNSALGGIPGLIGDMLSALGNIPGSLGLASVAALAFAPAMKTAGEAVYLAGKKFGESKFGENIKLTLNRQTNLFESVINKASEMNMALDASKSGLDAVGQAVRSLPALPAAGQTSFRGEMRRGRTGKFMGGGAREILNPEFLSTAAGGMAQRTQEAADASLLFAEGLGQAATEAKTIADYLAQANELRGKGESTAQRFIRQTIERGRTIRENQTSAEIARQRSAFLTGGQYSLSQVPARGELFPGGRTETRQPAYRQMLNTAATVSQLQRNILDSMSKQQGFTATIGQLERRTINDKGSSLRIQQQENDELERSIQIIRERNRELRQRPISAMTPGERGVIATDTGITVATENILDPASLAAERKRRIAQGRRRQEAIARARSEGLIGGAFPLLFGQGLGASVGGGLGGAVGGFAGGGLGFGLSLFGTVLGTAFDTFIKNATDLGKSLKDPTASLEAMKTSGLKVSDSLERNVKLLIESGEGYKAQSLVLAELNKQLGPDGLQNIQKLTSEQKKLEDSWKQLTANITSFLLPAVTDFIGIVGDIVGGLNELSKLQIPDWLLQAGATSARIGLGAMSGGTLDVFDTARAIQRAKREGQNETPTTRPPLSPDLIISQRQTAGTTEQLRAQADLLAKTLALTGMTLEKDGQRYIIASKNVAQQEYDNKLLEIKNNWIGKIFNKEQNLAQIRVANLEYAARLKQLNEEAALRQEQVANNVLQAELANYQQGQKAIQLLFDNATLEQGTEAGLKRELELANRLFYQKLAEFQVEERIALIEAAKNGTLKETKRLYDTRIKLLNGEAYLQKEITRQRIAQIELDKLSTTAEIKRSAVEPFTNLRQSQELDRRYSEDYYKLLKSGIMPAEAERRANFNRLSSESLTRLDREIAIKEALLQQANNLKASADEINKITKDIADLRAGRAGVLDEILKGPGAEQRKIPGMEVQQFISSSIESLNNLETVAIRVSQSIGDAVGGAMNEGINGLIDGTMTAQEVFANFLKNVSQILMQEATKMIATYIAIGLARQFAGLLGGGSATKGVETNAQFMDRAFSTGAFNNVPSIGGYANGGMFSSNGIVPFAMGGAFTNSIVTAPTLFKFANGGAMSAGVMGEAGPEAVMPLTRGRDGKLGVQASGGGDINVTVNVDASGSKVQGDDAQANQLGRIVSAAVQAEIIKQKRPGGVLA